MNHKFSLILFYSFFFCSGFIYGQRENVWAFGYNGGIDFNSSPPGTFSSSIESVEAAASICDHAGQLLFYTDGNNIWDKNNNLMPNGSSLITDFTYNFGPTESTCGGAIIVPFISDSNKYYVFTIVSNFIGSYTGRLYYSVVDMELNGGLGDVIPSEKGIFVDSQNTEHLSAVAGDRCNIWLLTVAVPSTNALQIRAYEITDAGVNSTPVISDFEIPYTLGTSYGQMDVSPNRNRIAVSRNIPLAGTLGAATELYSFDPATGTASNQIVLDNAGGYGVAFSPDGSKLYKNGANEISQYDLSLPSTAAIINSLTDIGPAFSCIIKRAPDGRMYVGNGNSLAAINYPDLPGTDCGYAPNAINISTLYSLPNIVPILTHDTFYHSDSISTPCFAANTSLAALNDSTGWDYVWSTGTSGATATVSNNGTYWVSYRTPPCNFNIDTFYVVFETRLPILEAIAGCYNEQNGKIKAIPFLGDTVTYSYTWRNADSNIIQGPVQSNTGDSLVIAVSGQSYFLHTTAPNGCDTNLTISMPMPDYTASFSLSDSIVCIGTPINFLNTSTSDITGFHWEFGDSTGPANEADPMHTYTSSGQYTIRLIGNTGYPCYDTAYHQIIVDSMPDGSFSIGRDSICTGEAIVFTPQINATVTELQWNFGDSSYAVHNAQQAIQHAYDSTGSLPVTLITHPRACPDTSFTDTVHIFPLPVVNLGNDTSLCLNGAPIYLQNFFIDTTYPVRSILWSTGDTSRSIKVVHPGKYSLTIATEPVGCSTTDEIEVKKDCYIDIPNVFSPNSDGVNDYFFPRQLLSKSLRQFKMQILNRWGQVIFETTNINGRGWDGKFNNVDQPAGVYVYQIDATISNEDVQHYQGNVTLIR